MNPSNSCPECGKPLPTGSDVCPACLMAQAIASRTLDDGPREIPPPPAPEEIAEKFPQFEILECLGRGGMGVVYKARQKSLNRLVAIKILAPEREREVRFAGRFAKEAEMLAKLSHPHIVTIHDFGETGGLYYLVMEFINGVNLRDLLRDGKMVPEQALAIVPPICEALQFAHDHGIVHRDIKPENILLDREGRVKIADFGIATLAGDAAERAGTPHYMAPEQNAGAANIDHRADVYALGVVLYEMLTGERPTTIPVAPSRRVQIDVRLDEVVLRALAQQPELRLQSAGDFNTVLGEVTREVTTHPMRPEPAAETPRIIPAEEKRREWLRHVLHFAPAILLVIAWFSSGLERGAVLILSVLVVAVLVVRALVQAKPAQANTDAPARWALGLLLAGSIGTPLLLSFTTKEEGVLLAGAACLLGSLVLAVLSWRTRRGKTIALIWAGLFTIAAVMAIFYQSLLYESRDEALVRAHSQRLEHAEIAAVLERKLEDYRPGPEVPPHKDTSSPGTVTIKGKGNYPTIAAALEDASPGAVIRIAAGNYPERIVIRKPVTLIGAGWEKTRLHVQGPYLAESRDYEKPEVPSPEQRIMPVVEIETNGQVNLEGISLSMSGTPPEGALSPVSLISAVKCDLSLRDCALVGSVGNGIEARIATLKMDGCLVAAAWNTGIVLGEACKAEIRDCTVRNCYYASIVMRPFSRQSTIDNCCIAGSAWHGIQYDNVSPKITGNLIHNHARSGIYASGNTAGEITGNVIARNEMDGISCWFESRDKIERNLIAANTRESIRLSGMASPQIRGNIISGPGIIQGLIEEEKPAAKSYGTPTVERNIFWGMASPWMRGTEVVTLPKGNRIYDPQLDQGLSLPAGSPFLAEGIGPEKPPEPRTTFPDQPEELAIIPAGESRDFNAWRRPK
ncbi:protein kinase [Luteolibacter arcticus]|uniref:Protein kinase n=1 Tax=Luteolibacter arcticus TaxID=1581411 RepID=A0ABT3GFZ7_9BACT|nr:protein kinase [Luteolibacter arcticus]MCW1922531.1 protein kinase [Luteolibacter arcticus]